MKSVTQIVRGLFFAAGLASASIAVAEEPSSPAPAAEASDAEILSLDDMESLAGGTGVDVHVITTSVLDAVNNGNTVTGDVVGSGQVNIGSDAFAGYSGLGNFVINTGHNNNLQSSMNVSIALAPTTTVAP
ncbi:MAG: hypothetical protein U1E03_13620 [Hyphomonadaceae bacterium]